MNEPRHRNSIPGDTDGKDPEQPDAIRSRDEIDDIEAVAARSAPAPTPETETEAAAETETETDTETVTKTETEAAAETEAETAAAPTRVRVRNGGSGRAGPAGKADSTTGSQTLSHRPRPKVDDRPDLLPYAAHDRMVYLGLRGLGVITDHAESTENEVGGFLVGWMGEDELGSFTVIERAHPALQARGARVQLEIPPSAFAEMHESLDTGPPGEALVGWYHTHPGIGIFLSSYDQFLHTSFFRVPGQVAVVADPQQRLAGIFVSRLDGVPVSPQRANAMVALRRAREFHDFARPFWQASGFGRGADDATSAGGGNSGTPSSIADLPDTGVSPRSGAEPRPDQSTGRHVAVRTASERHRFRIRLRRLREPRPTPNRREDPHPEIQPLPAVDPPARRPSRRVLTLYLVIALLLLVLLFAANRALALFVR